MARPKSQSFRLLYSLTNTLEGLQNNINQRQPLLQVGVDDPIRVQIVEALRKIASKLLDGLLRQLLLLLDKLEEVASCAVLEDDPQVIACLVPIEELKDVSVLEVVEDAHLLSVKVSHSPR